MPIDTLCPGCQAKLRIGDEFAGQDARCPRCDTLYNVPASTVEQVAILPSADEVPSPPIDHSPASVAPLAEPPLAPALPPADGTHWFLRTPEGPIYGPTTAGDFERWVVEGRVTPDCFISPGDNIWHPATELYPSLAAPRPKAAIRPLTLERLQKQPHRGALILLLGIMGIVTTCPIPSIMAWVMGSHDLGEMHMGRMDDSGQGMTNTGRLLGMIFSMIYIVGAVIAMFVLVMVAARG